MKKSTRKKLKRIFNLYNLAITACVILIIVSLVIIIEPDFSGMFDKNSFSITENKKTTDVSEKEEKEQENKNNVKVVENDNSGEEISEKDARKLAKKQFKELDEKNLDVDKFEVLKIEREGEEYYYISSAENTVEISVKTGEVTRINSVKVEK